MLSALRSCDRTRGRRRQPPDEHHAFSYGETFWDVVEQQGELDLAIIVDGATTSCRIADHINDLERSYE
eukprot:7548628-Pyramimonas_sp.AAC.1